MFVNGKNFDALQPADRMLWEVKDYDFDNYTAALRQIVVENDLPELLREAELAKACGYGFTVGVRSATHRQALREVSRGRLNVVVMNWC